MPNEEQREEELKEHESRTHRALHAYRERRVSRRAEDTYFGSADCLIAKPQGEGAREEWERRRANLVEEAVDNDMPGELAEMLYDVAVEEGLDPILAYELVRCGIGVQPPDEGVSNAADQPTIDKYRPEWLKDPIPSDDLLRERTLRLSFRRLRGKLEEEPDVDEAFRAFAREPDVGPVGY